MKNTKILLGILIFSTLLLASGVGAVSGIQPAEDGDDDGIDDSFEEEHSRVVNVEVGSDEVQIESQSETGGTEDQVQIKLEFRSEGTKVHIGYEKEVDNTELEAEMEVTFQSLIEFVDGNANGIYEFGEEISERVLDDIALNAYTTITSDDGETLHYLNTSTADGVFSLHVYASESFSVLNNVTITPMEVKIDIEIDGFTYSDGASQLALLIKIDSEYEHEENEESHDEAEGYTEDENEIETKVEGTTSFFSWAEFADVDGVDLPVLNTPVESDDEDGVGDKFYLIYPRGTHIYHDPKVGLYLGGAGFPYAITFIVVGVAAAGTIVAIYLIKKRR
ncbi:MAG: hypothetical protein ACFFCS_20130 [Candidatus Hodarchaeota archaeon]